MKTTFTALAFSALLSGCSFSDKDTDIIRDKSSFFEVPLTAFHIDLGRYPTSEEGLHVLIQSPTKDGAKWRGPYIEGAKIPLDPWGRPVHYRFPAQKSAAAYDIWSLGPDGIESSDDIGNWKK
jgi:general secretion pathway protein G